ncbi:hypothetical protein MKX01_031659 [Papaver californicum]|nr:hypothetical protein MKX01_031659 [Papaver californicum]
MAASAGELASDDHQKMISLGLQQAVESLGKVEAKFDALLKVLVELQVNTSQIVRNTGIYYKDDEDKHKAAAPNPSSSSVSLLHQPALASTLLTPNEDTTTRDNLAENMERKSKVNDNQEITQAISNDQIEESVDFFGGYYQELDEAVLKSDWKAAIKFLKKNPEAVTKVIFDDSQTIVKLMPPETLEYKTRDAGFTALHYAATYGYTEVAEVMVNKNPKLTQIEDKRRRVPLLCALTSVSVGQRETVEYLYSVTRDEHPSPFSGNQGELLLCRMIDAGFYDIASSLVDRFPELVIDRKKKVQTSAMNYMAERPFAFASGAKLKFWQGCNYSLVKVDINTTYELDTQTNERNSEESLPQSSEGTIGDEENPLNKRSGGSSSEENYPPENSENMEEDKAKTLKWDTFGENILVGIVIVGYLIYLMIKNFFVFLVFLVRYIWTPGFFSSSLRRTTRA